MTTQTQNSTKATLGYMPKARKESPLGLLISIIRDDPDGDKEKYYSRFRSLILLDDYCGFLDALISEWVSIKFSTALRAARPPSIEELRDKAASRRAARQRTVAMVEKAKELIGARLLEFIMPNGKMLRNCTGAECKQFGGIFTHIGKRVGNRVVGDVLSAEQIARISNKFTAKW